jgi:hypothetical protein
MPESREESDYFAKQADRYEGMGCNANRVPRMKLCLDVVDNLKRVASSD